VTLLINFELKCPLQGFDSLADMLATLLFGEKSDTAAESFKIPHNF
jgi:hypothetical protein